MDRTGSVDALMWRLSEELHKGLSSPVYVGVEGQAHEYRGTLQVKVEQLSVLGREEVAEEDYLPTTEKDRRALAEEILRAGRSFDNEHLRQLFESLVSDEEFWTAFCEAPAAKGMHHARIGGLLEHSVNCLEDRRARSLRSTPSTATSCSSGPSSMTSARCASSPGARAASPTPPRAASWATWSSENASSPAHSPPSRLPRGAGAQDLPPPPLPPGRDRVRLPRTPEDPRGPASPPHRQPRRPRGDVPGVHEERQPRRLEPPREPPRPRPLRTANSQSACQHAAWRGLSARQQCHRWPSQAALDAPRSETVQARTVT